MQTYQGPMHDMNSHGADAFGEYAVNCGIVPPAPEAPRDAAKRVDAKLIQELTYDDLIELDEGPRREQRA
jgi:hypothetical protein